MNEGKLIGVVKWFNNQKGFGFVACDGKDYFVHYKSIQSTGYKELKEKQRVSFVPKKGDKGMLAEMVNVLAD